MITEPDTKESEDNEECTVGDTEDTSGVFEPAVYYDEHGM